MAGGGDIANGSFLIPLPLVGVRRRSRLCRGGVGSFILIAVTGVRFELYNFRYARV